MNKKMLTRLTLNIINKCNQKCSWCFQGEWKKGPIKMMSLENVEKLLKWKEWDDGFLKAVFILGGEPTLHPQLLEILDLIHHFNANIMKNLLTNLSCDIQLLEELIARRVVFFVNVDQFEATNNTANQEKILKNLECLNRIPNESFKYNVSVTVSEPDKDFTFLYEILKRSNGKIYNLRVAPSCIGLDFQNQFQTDSTDDYYNKVLEVMEKCREIDSTVRFSSECPANSCMISPELFDRLKNYGYDLRLSCGDPEPNVDILPDMSCHWCYALENVTEMRIPEVFAYPGYNSMVEALYQLKEKFERKYPPQCDRESCSHPLCSGPCPALNYYFARCGQRLPGELAKKAVPTIQTV
jgi:organic radical activating enzyme